MSEKNLTPSPISTTKFYSNCSVVRKEIEEIQKRYYNLHKLEMNTRQIPRSLMGPTQYWAVFYKQANALDDAQAKNSTSTTLLTFAHEDVNARRLFTVAHPEVYWEDFNKKLPEQRCAYEVIPKYAPCLLYLDLEFQKNLNENSNGPRMTKTIIDIICAYMKKIWGIFPNEENVINLDSTTNIKFSRHVIFRIRNIAFKDNSHVGQLIKKICNDIDEYLSTDGYAFHDILSYFTREQLEELIINTDKKRKLFIDTSVYTKNRQFRIYKATKWGKLTHLELAHENKYITLDEYQNKDLGIFLESLISYFTNKTDLVLLEVNENLIFNTNKYVQHNPRNELQTNSYDYLKESPYPAIDKFILDLVYPGTIRVLIFYEESKTIIYDITGNRYCANIGRPHKSNNIYWIADLKRRCAYQKCHDQDDCGNFKSDAIPFPFEISFKLNEEDDNLFSSIPSNLEDSTASNNTNSSF